MPFSYDPNEIQDFLEAARDTVRADVEEIMYSTPTFWRTFTPTGVFPLGKGFEQQAKYYEEPVANDHQPWLAVQDLVDAGEACDIKAEEIQFGRSLINFALETMAIKSPNFCIYNAIAAQDFRADLSQAIGSMGQIGVRKLENRYRNAYLELAGRHYLMVQGLPFRTDGQFPTAAAQTIGMMHESVLPFIAGYFDAVGGYTQNAAMIGGEPYYWAVGHHATWDRMIRSDPEAREDIRNSSKADSLLSVMHLNFAYKRFILVNDPQVPRFTWSGAAWVRVPYFTPVAVDFGVANRPNPAWETATHEALIFIANRLGPKALWLPTSADIAAGTEFGPLHTNLGMRWINKPTNEKNPLMWSGYFLGNASLAMSPEQNRFVVALMVAREVGGIVIDEPSSVATPSLAGAAITNPAASAVCTLKEPIPCFEGRTLETEASNVDLTGAAEGEQLTYRDADGFIIAAPAV